MPPDTLLLSVMLRELSARPGFTQTLLADLEGAKAAAAKKGPALLTPSLVEELRKRILGRDWQGLDRFPGWTMRAINPTVRVAGHVLAKDKALEGLSAVHPGSPAPALDEEQARSFLEVGPYALGQEETVSLDAPSTLPPFTSAGFVTSLGAGVTRGDGPNALAAEHAESQRLAFVLNRLAANQLAGVKRFCVTVNGETVDTPEDLLRALGASGHEITVQDARYFANFGHLHFQRSPSDKPLDVMMPFWVNTQIAVPTRGSWWRRLFFRPRPLLAPVSHAEYEWHLRAPRVRADAFTPGPHISSKTQPHTQPHSRPHINADVSYYFGIDGKSEWRTMDTLDQAWVLKRNAHTYTGAQAVEVTRLAGLITVAIMHQHAKRPGLPFGGYYALGVCQDGVSAIEKKLTGRVTLFPNTADSSLFDDPADAEVNQLMQTIPKDRAGAMPEPERVFGSLPAEPGPRGDFSAITVPGLAEDLRLSFAAWQAGSLGRMHGRLYYWAWTVGLAAAAATLAAVIARRRTATP